MKELGRGEVTYRKLLKSLRNCPCNFCKNQFLHFTNNNKNLSLRVGETGVFETLEMFILVPLPKRRCPSYTLWDIYFITALQIEVSLDIG